MTATLLETVGIPSQLVVADKLSIGHVIRLRLLDTKASTTVGGMNSSTERHFQSSRLAPEC